MEEEDPAALKMEYLDIIISDVRTTNGLGFSDKRYFLFSETTGLSEVKDSRSV